MAEKEVKSPENKEETVQTSENKPAGNTGIYKILAYFGILWLVGLLVQEKDDKSVKFHVGQGMLITIVWFIIGIVNNFVIANIFVTTKVGVWGLAEYQTTSSLGLLIMWVLWLIPSALSLIGIINAAKDQDKELPVIGKLAFYK